MSAEIRSVGVKALRAAFAIIAAAKLDAPAIAARYGISPSDLDDPDYRFSHDGWTELLNDVEQRTHPGIAIQAAADLPMGHWDIVDYMIASSATLGDAIRKLVRYFPLISTGARHVVELEGDEARIVREYDPPTKRSRSGAEFAVASIVLRLRQHVSAEWSPLRVAFAHSMGAAEADYRRVFRCPVVFEQPNDVIVLDRGDLELPLRHAASELAAVLERHADLVLERLPSSLASRIEASLAGDLSSGQPTLARTAKRLGMGARTLQRRLDESGIAYRDLVERTRERLARRYLADRTISLGEVAFLLGFNDASAFYKAFRRWTGMTPLAYRVRSATERRRRTTL